MGEEVFQFPIASPTYTSYPISLYKARQAQHGLLFCWCEKGYFSCQYLIWYFSLLVLNRVPFPCWCLTGSSSHFKNLPWQSNKITVGHKLHKLGDNHQLVMTAKYGSHHFTSYGEIQFKHFLPL